MRQLFGIVAGLLLSCGAVYAQSGASPARQEETPSFCSTHFKDYTKVEFPETFGEQISIVSSLAQCSKWAREHQDWSADQEAFVALTTFTFALGAQVDRYRVDILDDKQNPPVACREFQSYQKVVADAQLSAAKDRAPEGEVPRAMRAEQDYEAGIAGRDVDGYDKFLQDTVECMRWAYANKHEAVAAKIKTLLYEVMLAQYDRTLKGVLRDYNALAAEHDDLLAVAKRQAAALSLANRPIIWESNYQPAHRIHCEGTSDRVGYSWWTTLDCH